MNEVSYSIYRRLPGVPFSEAVTRTTEALKSQGFGVLTSIDVQATLKQKIGAEFRPYVILGACAPELAHRALSGDDNVGLLLPCNVVVAATDDGSEVSIADPQSMLALSGSATLQPVAAEAAARLKRVATLLTV